MIRHINNKNVNKDKTLFEILHIIFRRKVILIIAVFIALVLAFIYNNISTPMYEAKGLLKKETAKENKNQNDFYDIVRLQTQDEVETEMELIKTGDVLGRVVDELKLNFIIKTIITP
ncbi:MAG: Wzz/FepE/Etk N-terminal domain-containing protein [Nitrososphaeraceae archaeon]|nr:Wzz/FepE/Etk N-terminal domain-containing protein [Nitrososphaeraceae archaeon]